MPLLSLHVREDLVGQQFGRMSYKALLKHILGGLPVVGVMVYVGISRYTFYEMFISNF